MSEKIKTKKVWLTFAIYNILVESVVKLLKASLIFAEQIFFRKKQINKKERSQFD